MTAWYLTIDVDCVVLIELIYIIQYLSWFWFKEYYYFPFLLHYFSPYRIPESLRSNSDPDRSSLSTTLDGCVIVTSRALYHCRQRSSPEGLFLDLALSERDASLAENLGITLGLDMNALYEQAAERKLTEGDVQRAMSLYRNSQVHIGADYVNSEK